MLMAKMQKLLCFSVVTVGVALVGLCGQGVFAADTAQTTQSQQVNKQANLDKTFPQNQTKPATQTAVPTAQANKATQPAQVQSPQTIAQVVWVKGEMKATGSDKKERILKRGDFVYAGDTLNTTATGSGQIIFTDSSLVSFRENTTYKIQEYKYSASAKPTENKYVANLVKGGFRTITGAISKGHPENYQVSTPVATIGVRGTNYSVFCGAVCNYKLIAGEILVKNGFGTLVLNAEIRFGEVPSGDVAPKSLTREPDVFLSDPPIKNVQVPSQLIRQVNITTPPVSAPSGGGAGPTAPGGVKPSGGTTSGTASGASFSESPSSSSSPKAPSGPASGFCIQ